MSSGYFASRLVSFSWVGFNDGRTFNPYRLSNGQQRTAHSIFTNSPNLKREFETSI